MSPPESKVDVLVIGAGPAGLFAAHGLARAGVSVKIVDQRPCRVAAGQADGIQPRTIEVLQSYGLAERLLREANQMHMAAFYNPSADGGIERTGRAPDVTATTARWPFEATLHQGAIEALFMDPMREMGLEVDRPTVPTALELSEDEELLKDPQSYPVKVTVKHLDHADAQNDTEVVHAKFVLGADGAHSWVRKILGVTLDGEQTVYPVIDYIWGVVDIIPSSDFPDIRNKTAIHSPNGSCMIIPREGDKIRLYIQLSEKDVEKDIQTGRVDKSKVGPQQLMEVAKKIFKPFNIDYVGEIDWWTIYVIGQRVASQFSVKERVFIAGDACHTHSPKAGQGMNASMNDSHNLVWKLTHVLRGNAEMSLLKTYEFERRKYAQDLIDFDKQWSALFSGKPRTEDNQDGVAHEDFLKAFQTFGAFSSGIGVHYAPSAITNYTHQSLSPNQLIGTRILPHVFIRAADARPYEIQDLLPSDTKFKILVFAGNTTKPEQWKRVDNLAKEISTGEHGFLQIYNRDLFDVWTISSGKKEVVDYTDIPEILRPHWSHVLLDDTDMYARTGGGGYERYGIDPERGAVVVVRPDGYVGIVAPLEGVKGIQEYLSVFLKKSSS
ncbi:hypothetical protein EUX98_g7209 [Antrodiella citrinella]|uniref:FAD-binding domain-containing protein n=1 Tax=Antrodiella citrinella TaxID=2447956 RepID=A0A4V3XI08_9APHY|nr:hypothetical protein EUX98_g7209 [Antrodiella citrinella]